MNEQYHRNVGVPEPGQEGYLTGFEISGTGLTRLESDKGVWYVRPFQERGEIGAEEQLDAIGRLGGYIDVVEAEQWRVDYKIFGRADNRRSDVNRVLLASREVPIVDFDINDPRHTEAAAELATQLVRYYAEAPDTDDKRRDGAAFYGPMMHDVANTYQYTWLEKQGSVKPLLFDVGMEARTMSAVEIFGYALETYFHLIENQASIIEEGALEEYGQQFQGLTKRFFANHDSEQVADMIDHFIRSHLAADMEESLPNEVRERADSLTASITELLDLHR